MSQPQLDLFDPNLTHPIKKPRARRGRGPNLLVEMMRIALIVCRRQLNDYSCPKSKQTYTQPQLLACLVLKTCQKLTYRGVIDLLEASAELREVLGLEQVPAYQTLQEFSKRVLTPKLLDTLVGEVLALLQEKGLIVEKVAMDSTGVETSSASAHFVSRAKRKRGGYVKLSLAVACTSIVLVGLVTSVGPCNDLCEAGELLWRASSRVRPGWLLADSGYDAEWVHAFARTAWDARSHIPPVPKTKDGSIKSGPGRIRSGHVKPYLYGERWHAESFISGMKRTCGSTLGARSQPALMIEASLKALAYAIRR
jgi:hypothetical protein